MDKKKYNLLVVLGPTASGKTSLGVKLANLLDGEIISADSRQVYKGLDIGSGKDLSEYSIEGKQIPYHLIDIADLSEEFSLYTFQKKFFEVFLEIEEKKKIPIMVGGTGLYIESVIAGYELVEAPKNMELREELKSLSMQELEDYLRKIKPKIHNRTDTKDRNRLIRAIEIEDFSSSHKPIPTPKIKPLILGTKWNRKELREKINVRLKERFEEGMIKEVRKLLRQGVPEEKLLFLGLEYKLIAKFLNGEIKTKNDLFQKLDSAICQFAKRQDTWFRRMEKKGFEINWIESGNFEKASSILSTAKFESL